MSASKSDHVFVRTDGEPYRPDDRFNLVDHLRRALKHAGIVDGYRFICRRKGCGFEETRPAPGEDRCPRCSMRLWVSPLPRKLRFYDLRHTHATLLRKAGVDLGAVQLSLGHTRDHRGGLRPQRRRGLPGPGRAGAHVRAREG